MCPYFLRHQPRYDARQPKPGRFFIPYLGRGRFHGVEPNQWLIEPKLEHEIGRDLVALKDCIFIRAMTSAPNVCGTDFDFVFAQSILSHTGLDLLVTGLTDFRDALAPSGLAAATFIHADP